MAGPADGGVKKFDSRITGLIGFSRRKGDRRNFVMFGAMIPEFSLPSVGNAGPRKLLVR